VSAVAIVPKPKRKIPRIRFGALKPINLTAENWLAVEKAYGRSVPQEAREQIEMVTARFLQLAVAEDTGSMNDAIQRAARLRKCAQSLIDAIRSRPIDDITREYIDDELAEIYTELKCESEKCFPTRNYVSKFSLEVGRFVNACDTLLDHASQYDYWPNGAAWEVWIRELIGILNAHALSTGVRKDAHEQATGVRKDTDMIKSRGPSPFVEFVFALQSFVPRKHARATHSKGALAVAIHNARRETKQLVTPKKGRVP
jgi:hypothetical protein